MHYSLHFLKTKFLRKHPHKRPLGHSALPMNETDSSPFRSLAAPTENVAIAGPYLPLQLKILFWTTLVFYPFGFFPHHIFHKSNERKIMRKNKEMEEN